MIPTLLILAATAVFFIAERLLPGRTLPESPGWYARAAFLNICQLGIVLVAGIAWNRWLQAWSLLHLTDTMPDWAQGLLGWFLGTFAFYWWHRLRHDSDLLWRVLHQVHHSPARIEMLTAFYKHPLEIAADSILSSILLYTVLGASPAASAWFNVFAVVGEYFYHSNLRTPRWVGWFLQRPEHHSIHHEFSVHRFNYGDITWWDRLFGTFCEAEDFAPVCGLGLEQERHLGHMLAFRESQ